MGKLELEGLDDILVSLQDIMELPDSVAEEMLEVQANIILKAQQAEAAKLGMYSRNGHNNARSTSESNQLPGQSQSYSTGELAASLRIGSLRRQDGVPTQSIYFSGSRKRGGTVTKNAEIAFLNEYGTRTINARNFVRTANQKASDAALAAAKAVYDRFLASKNL